ncbi:hypothetical protein [Chlorogloeopsis fritschii]|nr:hypothetical protein [Chlorogloeopsis fritschii]
MKSDKIKNKRSLHPETTTIVSSIASEVLAIAYHRAKFTPIAKF